MTRKPRPPVPVKTADKVMYQADLLCCVCESRGSHIHHIDGNPANNFIENLVLLCFDHHNEVSTQGGLQRKLTPGLLRHFRTLLYQKVEAKRRLPRLSRDQIGRGKLTSDEVFQLAIDAVTIREVEHMRFGLEIDNSESVSTFLSMLGIYVSKSGFRARREILEALWDVAYRTRFPRTNQSAHLAKEVVRVTYEAMPIRNTRIPSATKISPEELELLNYGMEIGLQLAYDGSLYAHDLQIVNAGGELLWKLLRFSRINKLKKLQAEILQEFATALDAAKRAGDQDSLTLITLYRNHGLKGDWHYPAYPDDLADKILFAE